MTMDISQAVKQLLDARRSGVQVAPPFALPDRDAVYAIQDGVAGRPDPFPAGRSARARRPPSPIRRRCWPARW